MLPIGIIIGFVAWFLVRYLVAGLYTVDQNERAVKTSFGRAQRLGKATTTVPLTGTTSGERSRRYHALLLTATNPPTGRMVLANSFDDSAGKWTNYLIDLPAGARVLVKRSPLPYIIHPAIVPFWGRWRARPIRGHDLSIHGH